MRVRSMSPTEHDHEFKRVYVWEVPVRVFHWVLVVCAFVLTVTGLLIAHPPAISSAAEASFSYWFGVNRFIHFVAAYVFLFNLVSRIYWGFVGNQYANWRNFIPLRRAQFRQVAEVFRVDIVQSQKEPVTALGHNQLAYFSYLVFYHDYVEGQGVMSSMCGGWKFLSKEELHGHKTPGGAPR